MREANQDGGVLPHYNYELPAELVAHAPAVPRDSARLMVYEVASDTVTFTTFSKLADFLPPDALLVTNETRVVPARVTFTKDTGGLVIGLILVDRGVHDGVIRTITKGDSFVAGRVVRIAEREFDVLGRDDRMVLLRWRWKETEDSSVGDAGIEEQLRELLEREGRTPLPPYLDPEVVAEKLDEATAREQYQTVFAATPGSVAAPTASLHFTDDVFKSLEQKGIERTSLELRIGLGTFAPVDAMALSERRLHSEQYRIPAGTVEAVRTAKKTKRPVIAAGTTATRALEAAAAEQGLFDQAKSIDAETRIFILPPHQFAAVDGLITNFHVPGSSLMAIVDAFLEHKGARRRILDLYREAIAQKMRFYSFGDAMLII